MAYLQILFLIKKIILIITFTISTTQNYRRLKFRINF